MYTVENFKTKKALKQALADGKRIEIYQPGLGETPRNGTVCLEGPHYPQAHSWYAEAVVKYRAVIKVT